MSIKNKVKDYFHYLFYFYNYLKYRVFIAFGLSFTKGVLDGFGLAMFIPLLKMANPEGDGESSDDLGKLSFLPEFFESLGINMNIYSILIIIFVFFLLKGIVTFIEGYVKVIYQQLFIREIRTSNILLLNTLKFSEFVKTDSGRIQNTFSAEVERVNVAYKSYFKSIEYGVLVLVYLTLAFSANAQFAILVGIGGVVTNFLFKWLFLKTKKLSKEFTISAHSFQGFLIQQVSNFKYLKATGLNLIYGEKLKDKISEIEELQKRIGIVGSTLSALREPITMFVVIVAIIIEVRYFNPDISLIILSLLFLYRALTFLMALQEFWNKFLGVSGSLENLQTFTQELRSNREKNGNSGFEEFSDSIELKHIYFNYKNNYVLNDINLCIQKRETIAIVGESGSGKTTLMNIIAGLLPPSKGEIRIDELNYSKLDLNEFRKKIGYISQEAPIFNDTIYNNITFWSVKNKENYDRFKSAIKEASIYDFVMSMDKKEEELIGNNGINISGGQKQRLSIARELYKNVEILLLDEATSALDGETETSIQKNLENLRGKHTIIMIAHRLATIRNADRVIILKDGKIVDIGTFDELSDRSKLFNEMIRLQGMSIS